MGDDAGMDICCNEAHISAGVVGINICPEGVHDYMIA